MLPWESSGDVLRWWRTEVLGLTQQECAEMINVRPSALSNWERGRRAISVDLDSLDAALGADGVLSGLLWTQGSPKGIDAGQLWTKVFPGESRPVWVRMRSSTSRLTITGEWGVARMRTELEPGPNGVFITVGASVPDSPVIFHLSDPGWADFGSGPIPSRIPGAQVIDAVSLLERSSADGAFVDLFSLSLADKFAARSKDILELAEPIRETVEHFLEDRVGHDVPSWPPQPEGIEEVERQRFARLREARGLSLMAMAERLNAVTDIEVGRDTLRRFETDVGQPHDRMLPVAMDYALGAEGRLAALELRVGRGSDAVSFPPYWRGPIWVRVADDRGSGRIVLRRGNWHREYRFDGPSLVSAHWFDPSVPIRIEAEPQTRWAVGVGRIAGAESVDQGWAPITMEAAQQSLVETERALFTAMESKKEP